MRTITARRNAQIALPTMPWRTVVPRETHPRPTVTRARTDHPSLAPALAHRRHAATVCTGTDSPATHLRVHSAPENAPGDALGGTRLSARALSRFLGLSSGPQRQRASNRRRVRRRSLFTCRHKILNELDHAGTGDGESRGYLPRAI